MANITDKKPIMVRIADDALEQRVRDLAKEQGLSVNMTINLLLGYAFSQVDKDGKSFSVEHVFTTK